MEDEKETLKQVAEEIEEPIESEQQGPLELIDQRLDNLDADIMKNRRHTKALYEEIKQLKSTVKLLIEEVQSLE